MNRLDNFQCCLARKLGLGIFELGTSSLLNKFHCKETFHYLILKKKKTNPTLCSDSLQSVHFNSSWLEEQVAWH